MLQFVEAWGLLCALRLSVFCVCFGCVYLLTLFGIRLSSAAVHLQQQPHNLQLLFFLVVAHGVEECIAALLILSQQMVPEFTTLRHLLPIEQNP